jgi:hypothetical protein
MTQEEFYREACLRAMQGLLSAAGHYRDELIANPCEYVATAARHYATELTEQVYGGGVQWNEITHTPEQLWQELQSIVGTDPSKDHKL